MSVYRDTFRTSIDDPERFWAEQATAIDWYRPPTQVLDSANPPFYRWFPDGELNTCHN
ncbi:MAG: propionyl-CoA synthetase, partial [Pseudonocardiales bacterium]|nr:propionyl-CoA synthetase [Pseudonocardiales bacterium]